MLQPKKFCPGDPGPQPVTAAAVAIVCSIKLYNALQWEGKRNSSKLEQPNTDSVEEMQDIARFC